MIKLIKYKNKEVLVRLSKEHTTLKQLREIKEDFENQGYNVIVELVD